MSVTTKPARVIRMRKVPKNGPVELDDLRITTFKTAPENRLLVVHVKDPAGEAPSAHVLNDLRAGLEREGLRVTWVVTRGNVEIELTEEVAS